MRLLACPLSTVVDVVYVMRRLEEQAGKKNLALYMWFINLQKLHNSIDRSLLWKVLERHAIPAYGILAIRKFHDA